MKGNFLVRILGGNDGAIRPLYPEFKGKKMIKTITKVILLLCFTSLSASAKDRVLTMSLDDKFKISDVANWNIKVERELTLRFADVSVVSSKGYDFNLKLYFKCDTKDLAQFDTPEKMKRSVYVSTEKYLPYCVENKVELKELKCKRFGYITTITDSELAKKKEIPKDEYLYMTRGFYRVSKDSALGFSVMSNDIDSAGFQKVIDYILSFEK